MDAMLSTVAYGHGPVFANARRWSPPLSLSRPMTRDDSPDAVALRQVLARLLPHALILSEPERELLRGKVCAFVDARKHDGVPPERVIVEMRRVVALVGATASADRLVGEMVRWCIERYFGET
jgi:hypothetical protein